MLRLSLIPEYPWLLHTQGTPPEEGSALPQGFSLWRDVATDALKGNPEQAEQTGLLILDASRTEVRWPFPKPEGLITFPTFGAYGFQPVGSLFTLGLKGDMENPLNPKGTLEQWERLFLNYFLNFNHSSTYGSCLGIVGGEDPFIYNPQNPDVHFHAPTPGDHDFATFLRALQATKGIVCTSTFDDGGVPICVTDEDALGCNRLPKVSKPVAAYSFLK